MMPSPMGRLEGLECYFVQVTVMHFAPFTSIESFEPAPRESRVAMQSDHPFRARP